MIKGFTLIELMIVMVVLAVAATAVVPNFVKGIQSAELRTSAQTIISAVRLGQMRALTQGKWFRLVLDQSSYWVEEERFDVSKPSRQPDQLSFQKTTGKLGRLSRLPSGVVFKDYPTEVLLSPNGRITASEWKLCRLEECVSVASGRQLGQIEVVQIKESNHEAL